MRLTERTVRTLIGHRQVDVGLRCLSSLMRYSVEPLSLIIHDDGTLTQEDCDLLTLHLEGAKVLSRGESDGLVLPLLAHHPKCRAYRQRHPLALKLIDMALIEQGELAYCDSDILFLKPYTQLFSWPNGMGAAIFMQDSQEAYSLYPWHIRPFGDIKVPRKVNTGLILFRTCQYDLDFVEWFLGRPQLQQVFEKRSHWIEQTCWAALGWRVGCYMWNANQLIIANMKMDRVTEETIGIHFVAAYRDNLNGFPERSHELPPTDEAVVINAFPAHKSSSLRLLAQDVRRRL